MSKSIIEDGSRASEARETTASRLAEVQFEQSWALAGIVEREIRSKGQFRAKLAAYAGAFAEGEKIEAEQAERIIRTRFKERFQETPNAMLKRLMDREAQVSDEDRGRALDHAERMPALIKDNSGYTRPFYRAYDLAGAMVANELGITEAKAKSLIKETYEEKHGRSFYDEGKKLETQHHIPRVEKQRAEQKETQVRSRSR